LARPKTPIRYQEAQPPDAQAWRYLRRALWPAEQAGDDQDIDRYFQGLNPHIAVALLAWAGEHPIGFIEISLRSYAEGSELSPVPYIEGWYVASNYRFAGVGRGLVQAASRWALRRGFTELASDTTLDNSESIAAHKALGFAEVERQVNFLMPLGKGARQR